MSVEEKVPMSRTSITIGVVVLLCVAGFAYSQGWLNWSNSSYETESDKVGTEQTIDQEKMQDGCGARHATNERICRYTHGVSWQNQ